MVDKVIALWFTGADMTKPALTKDRADILTEIFTAKSQVEIAAALGLTRAAVNQWRRVPDKYVRRVSELSGVPMRRIRPDIYDAHFEHESAPAARAAA